MLVLRRRVREEVYLDLPGGDRVVVQVVEVDGANVRIGFTAPRGVVISRRELVDGVRGEGLEPKPKEDGK